MISWLDVERAMNEDMFDGCLVTLRWSLERTTCLNLGAARKGGGGFLMESVS